MTTNEFKKIVKEAAREVFQEELKEILLEAIRSPKATIVESRPHINNGNNSGNHVQQPSYTSTLTTEDKQNMRQNYLSIINETAHDIHNPNKAFNPIGVDPINGDLPEGELDMSQIMNLMGRK